MKDIVIVDAVRSAVGRAHKGSLANKRPDELLGEVIAALLARNPAFRLVQSVKSRTRHAR